MSTLYLHIGTFKTGTSSLQSFLDRNRERLGELGFYYPKTTHKEHEQKQYWYGGNGRPLEAYAWAAGQMQENRQQAKALMAQWAKDGRDVIVSSELLYDADGMLYADAKACFDQVKVIVFVRRQDEWLESTWNQEVKNDLCQMPCFPWTQMDWIKKRFDLYQHFESIAAVIGRENILAHVYTKGCDVIGQFLGLLGIVEDESFVRDAFHSNPSLPANYVEIKRLFNANPQASKLRKPLMAAIKQANAYQSSTHQPSHAPAFLTYDQRMLIWEQYREGNQQLVEKYSPEGMEGALLSPPECESAHVGIHPETMYQDLIGVISELFIRQQNQIEALQAACSRFVIPEEVAGSVIVWGMDARGHRLYQQLLRSGRYDEVLAVDRLAGRKQQEYGIPVRSAEQVSVGTYDYILVGVEDEKAFRSIQDAAISYGAKKERVLWIATE